VSEDQSIELKSTAKMFEGMLHFSESEDEECEEKFELRTCGFTSSIEESVNADGTDVVTGTGSEGIVGEQELNLSSLTDSDTNRCRLIDDFYALEGLRHFSDSDDEVDPEDKGEVFLEKDKVGTNKEETKVMTRDECKKAGIAPPPAYKAACPEGRRARSLSPKLTSSKTTKTASPKQTPKGPHSTPVAPQQATHGQGHGVNAVVASDALSNSTGSQPESGSKAADQVVPSPKKVRPLLSLQSFRPPRHQRRLSRLVLQSRPQPNQFELRRM